MTYRLSIALPDFVRDRFRLATIVLVILCLLSGACARQASPRLSIVDATGIQPGGVVKAISFPQDSRTIITLNSRGRIEAWDLDTAKLKYSRNQAMPLALSSSGNRALLPSRDELIVRDVETGARSYHALTGIVIPHRAVLSPRGDIALLIDFNGNQSLFDLDRGEPIVERVTSGFGKGYRTVYSPTFSPDGSRLVIASRKTDHVDIWDPREGRKLRSILAHRGGVRATALSEDGRDLVTIGMDDRFVRWDGKSGEPVIEYDPAGLASINRVLFVPGQSVLVSGHDDGTVVFWNMRSGGRLTTYQPHQAWVESLGVSPDGRFLASAGADKTLNIIAIDPPR